MGENRIGILGTAAFIWQVTVWIWGAIDLVWWLVGKKTED